MPGHTRPFSGGSPPKVALNTNPGCPRWKMNLKSLFRSPVWPGGPARYSIPNPGTPFPALGIGCLFTPLPGPGALAGSVRFSTWLDWFRKIGHLKSLFVMLSSRFVFYWSTVFQLPVRLTSCVRDDELKVLNAWAGHQLYNKELYYPMLSVLKTVPIERFNMFCYISLNSSVIWD